MPAGNIAGLIDLEGEPAEAFGGGEDGAGGRVGSGSERVARLSQSVAGTVSLPWGCSFRIAAGNVVLAHWKVGTFFWKGVIDHTLYGIVHSSAMDTFAL